ncbi:uncharacterized protein C1orf131 homolog [Sceloporus undulatus]|uniref:uncharacterized protein C1orf131 homolog n=1 Tax=Sceloporus undulatus TaxID=8520 RepID=UPI001C4BE729|nr:uncharacterized protein C1orf131 homolog [Sceloporus undulatus]
MAKEPVAEEEGGEASASASRLLGSVLDSLYDFGESLPNGHKKKKKNSQEKLAMTASSILSEDKKMNPEPGTAMPGKRKSVSSFFESLKDELSCDCITKNKSATECKFSNVATLTSAQQENTTEIEVVTFHGPHRKKKAKFETPEVDSSEEKASVQEKHGDGQAFNLEKARLEVHQFGITGFEKKEQRVLEQERAIMLGAKPPKKEYLNYKILQEKIKQKKVAKKEESVMAKKNDFLKKRKKKGHEGSKSKKKTKQSILPTGQVGTFKNGTLILRSSDIKKIKSSKVAK